MLPPWIEYHNTAAGSTMVSFDEYFDVGMVKKYHRAVTMQFFFKYLVDKVILSKGLLLDMTFHGAGGFLRDVNTSY